MWGGVPSLVLISHHLQQHSWAHSVLSGNFLMEGGSPVDHLPLQRFGKKLVNIRSLSRGPVGKNIFGGPGLLVDSSRLVPTYHGSEGP